MGFSSPPFASTSAFKAVKQGSSKFLLPAGAKIAMLGTSSSQGGNTYGANILSDTAVGSMQILRGLEPRIDFTTWADTSDSRGFHGSNYGFAGQKNEFITQFLDEIIAKKYDGVILQYSQNNVPADPTIGPALALVRSDAIKARNAGLGVYLLTLNPRSLTGGPAGSSSVIPLTDTVSYRKIIDYNNELERLAQELAVEFIDTRPVLCDFASSPLGPAKAGVSDDGLHLSPYGHQLWASPARKVIQRTVISGTPHRNFLAGSAGNLFSNGLLTGTGGAQAGTTQQNGTVGQSGPLPDKIRFGLTGGSTSNSSAITSIVADPEEGNALRAVFTLNAADATSLWRVLFTDTPAAGGSPISAPGIAGSWLRAYLRLFIEGGAALLQDAKMTMVIRDAANVELYRGQSLVSKTGTTEPFGDDATSAGISRWVVTEPILAPANAAQVVFYFEAQFAGTGTAALQISRPALRVVADPRF